MPEHFPANVPEIISKSEQPLSWEHFLTQELPLQYNRQLAILRRFGLAREIPKNSDTASLENDLVLEVVEGLVGMDGKTYQIPSIKDIQAYWSSKEKKDLMETKFKQGFSQLRITPFALPLETLEEIARRVILDHHKKGKLFGTKANLEDSNEQLEPLELDQGTPLYVWEDLSHADESDDIIYFPTSYNQQNPGGYTKQQLLDKTPNDPRITRLFPFPGWRITLVEPNPNLPAEGKGKTTNGRKQLEANQSSETYLKTIQTNPTYTAEQGDTPEDWLTQMITGLEENNQVIDDYVGKGKVAFFLSAYHKKSDSVLRAYWNRYDQQADLGGSAPQTRNSNNSARCAVG